MRRGRGKGKSNGKAIEAKRERRTPKIEQQLDQSRYVQFLVSKAHAKTKEERGCRELIVIDNDRMVMVSGTCRPSVPKPLNLYILFWTGNYSRAEIPSCLGIPGRKATHQTRAAAAGLAWRRTGGKEETCMSQLFQLHCMIFKKERSLQLFCHNWRI